MATKSKSPIYEEIEKVCDDAATALRLSLDELGAPQGNYVLLCLLPDDTCIAYTDMPNSKLKRLLHRDLVNQLTGATSATSEEIHTDDHDAQTQETGTVDTGGPDGDGLPARAPDQTESQTE